MPDPRFFRPSRSFTVSELARELNCTLSQDADPDYILKGVAPLSTAGSSDLSFLDNVRYREAFTKTKAGACFVSLKMAPLAPANLICFITETPYKTYARAAAKFYPEQMPEANISKQAFIHKSVKIGKGCVIEQGACLDEGVEVGDQVWIETGVTIRQNVKIGSHCRIGTNASVSHAIIGDHVRLYPGVRVGQDGFGFAIDPAGHVKVPQLGRVIIEDHVEIGANTTIDRGSGPDTIIGQGTWIDNLVQIGHNVKIGKGCIIIAQVGISGSTIIEDYVVLAGQAGLAGHLTIGKGARIAAQAGVIGDVPPGEEYMGMPARPRMQFLRQMAALNRLIKNKKND